MIRRTTWVVLVVFALLIAVVVFWQRYQENKPPEPTATPAEQDLFDLDADVVGMRLEKVGERVIELQRDDQKIWELTQPAGEETDVGAVESAVTQLLALRTLSTMAQVPDLHAIGMDPPAYRLLLMLSDGQQITLNVGKATPTGSGYYLLVSGRPLYVVDKYGMEAFLMLVDSPPIIPTPTSIPETPTEVAPAAPTP
ncbi:MAG: DUF4340 domain-containing protein [Anaerolineales bacterium]|nr:DUF4340 domain-containing protein [Anaerolineales bacterium]